MQSSSDSSVDSNDELMAAVAAVEEDEKEKQVKTKTWKAKPVDKLMQVMAKKLAKVSKQITDQKPV